MSNNIAETDIFTLYRGCRPLLVSVPHAGTDIPQWLQPRYVARALAAEDTDWFLDQLFSFVRERGASFLVPKHSRYVIDLNRPPENTPMYAGVNNTELCPTRFFTGDPLYREGQAPDDAEIARRLDVYWRPYHDALQNELTRLKAEHGHAVLFDGHSIKSQLPWLFEGTLPDLNLGTVDGASCDATLRRRLVGVIDSQQEFTRVVDGRFKGGYITRQYGRPSDGWHAAQLEMNWRCYMAEQAPFALAQTRVRILQPVLQRLVDTMLAWSPR